MAEPPQKKKKQFQGDMCNITLEALMQLAKTKRWLGKEMFHRNTSTKTLFVQTD